MAVTSAAGSAQGTRADCRTGMATASQWLGDRCPAQRGGVGKRTVVGDEVRLRSHKGRWLGSHCGESRLMQRKPKKSARSEG